MLLAVPIYYAIKQYWKPFVQGRQSIRATITKTIPKEDYPIQNPYSDDTDTTQDDQITLHMGTTHDTQKQETTEEITNTQQTPDQEKDQDMTNNTTNNEEMTSIDTENTDIEDPDTEKNTIEETTTGEELTTTEDTD